MESEKYSIIKYYWSCYCKAHRHTTKAVADRCIASSGPNRKDIRWTHDAMIEALTLYRSGQYTLKSLGEKYGLSGSRIRQVINKAERLERKNLNQ